MYLTFFGGAGGVTGSCTLAEFRNSKILVDCGMFQGGDFAEDKNSKDLGFDPAKLDYVILTHSHLDHVGRLPLLIKGGYKGKIFCTPATAELAKLILEDAVSVMTYNEKKTGKAPLYTKGDVEQTVTRFESVEYYEEYFIQSPGVVNKILKKNKQLISFKFYDAGHILGAAFVEIKYGKKKMVFSGDVGNVNVPILRDTDALPGGLEAIVCESTYGDRVHEVKDNREKIIEEAITEAIGRGGALMIPSFALERTQELLYVLNDLIEHQKRLPKVKMFLDSPLAIRATRVYEQYSKYYDEEAKKMFSIDKNLFSFPGFKITESSDESKRINREPNPKVVIAGAGMMNGGRILHHAIRYLSDKNSTLLIIGYQAKGTLGRRILEGHSPVNIFGEKIPVKCRVRAIGALSAHADQEKLMDWIAGGKNLPKKVFLNHGESKASNAFAKRLKEELNADVGVVGEGLRVKI